MTEHTDGEDLSITIHGLYYLEIQSTGLLYHLHRSYL